MTRSVLEDEIARKLAATRAAVSTHDRGVLLGFLFSLVPIFPLAIVGLGIGFFHRSMHRAGKLSGFDYALARRGLIFAAVNSVLSLAILAAAIYLAWGLDSSRIFDHLPRSLPDLIQFLRGGSYPASQRGFVT